MLCEVLRLLAAAWRVWVGWGSRKKLFQVHPVASGAIDWKECVVVRNASSQSLRAGHDYVDCVNRVGVEADFGLAEEYGAQFGAAEIGACDVCGGENVEGEYVVGGAGCGSHVVEHGCVGVVGGSWVTSVKGVEAHGGMVGEVGVAGSRL